MAQQAESTQTTEEGSPVRGGLPVGQGIAWLWKWLKSRQGQAAVAGGSTVAGGYLSNRNRTSTSASTSAPMLDPALMSLQDQIREMVSQRLHDPLPASYETSGISDINRAYGGVQQTLNNNLTARGLGTSPIAGAGETRLQEARGGDIARFQQQIPLIAQERQDRNLQQALQLLGQGRGLSGTQTTTAPGSAAGSGLSNLAQLLAFYYGQRGSGSFMGQDAGGYTSGSGGGWNA